MSSSDEGCVSSQLPGFVRFFLFLDVNDFIVDDNGDSVFSKFHQVR